jgi:hypothetical protein|tara:strand:- start:1108 stop:1734 length:627 start_codon:yes stop_codon:yes gene_type:complete
MNKKAELLNKVRAVLGISVELEKMELENGTVLESDSFESGAEIFIVVDEDKVATPVGEYETKDGKVIVVAEEGVIAEIKDVSEEEEAPVEEAPVAEEMAEDEEVTDVKEEEVPADDEIKNVINAIAEELAMLKAEIEKLKGGGSEDLSTEEVVTEDLSTQVEVELSTPSAEPISHTPDNTVNKKEQHLHAKKASKNSTLNRVFNNLNK